MATQFRMLDSDTLPQDVLTIRWTMGQESDTTAGPPDRDDEAFWPSEDSSHCAYVPPDRYASEQRKAVRRFNAWKRAEWEYIGVFAVARVYIPCGGQSFRILELQSAGVWGVESDSGKHIADLYSEQKGELLAELKTFAELFSADKISNLETK